MQATSTDFEVPPTPEAVDARVAGLTILYHPSLTRVGERALLTGLASGRSFELSRGEPQFAAPGARDRRPLADHRISRAPVRLQGTDDRTVTLECGDSRTPVVANGHPIAGSARFSSADLEAWSCSWADASWSCCTSWIR
jgi:two-component system nitrogen regulation response regulator GlnG